MVLSPDDNIHRLIVTVGLLTNANKFIFVSTFITFQTIDDIIKLPFQLIRSFIISFIYVVIFMNG